MVERATEAFLSNVGGWVHHKGSDDYIVIDNAFDIKKAIRAAIEAMRKPTKEMIVAAAIAGCEWDGGLGEPGAELAWDRFIDAALKEQSA